MTGLAVTVNTDCLIVLMLRRHIKENKVSFLKESLAQAIIFNTAILVS